jgi:hypothetical protein
LSIYLPIIYLSSVYNLSSINHVYIIYLSTHPSIHIYQSNLSTYHLSFYYLSTQPSVYIYQFIYVFISIPICLYIKPSSTYQSIDLSIYLLICTSLNVSLSILTDVDPYHSHLKKARKKKLYNSFWTQMIYMKDRALQIKTISKLCQWRLLYIFFLSLISDDTEGERQRRQISSELKLLLGLCWHMVL